MKAQLHARCPQYTKKHKIQSEKRDKVIKFRMQYKIRNDMFNALEAVRKCHREKKLEKLIKIAEHELGIQYRIYPSFLMPRKNDFVVDMCNYIAMAHIDDIIKSFTMINSKDSYEYDLLKKLLRVYWVPKNTAVPYVFGDQSTYRDPAEPNTSFLEYRRNIARLANRLAQKPMLKIERCHLLHEMGRENLKEQRLEEASELGRKIMAHAESVSHYWIFLGHILLCRAGILQRQFDKALNGLEPALSIAKFFKSEELQLVLKKAIEVSSMLKN